MLVQLMGGDVTRLEWFLNVNARRSFLRAVPTSNMGLSGAEERRACRGSKHVLVDEAGNRAQLHARARARGRAHGHVRTVGVDAGVSAGIHGAEV